MIRLIKKLYYRRLFLRIYFAHLNHPSQSDTRNAMKYATYDIDWIHNTFEKSKESSKN